VEDPIMEKHSVRYNCIYETVRNQKKKEEEEAVRNRAIKLPSLFKYKKYMQNLKELSCEKAFRVESQFA
jgi:hypothetical protein